MAFCVTASVLSVAVLGWQGSEVRVRRLVMRKLKLYISFPTRFPRLVVDCGYFVSKVEGSARL